MCVLPGGEGRVGVAGALGQVPHWAQGQDLPARQVQGSYSDWRRSPGWQSWQGHTTRRSRVLRPEPIRPRGGERKRDPWIILMNI